MTTMIRCEIHRSIRPHLHDTGLASKRHQILQFQGEFSTQNYDNVTDRISQKLQICKVVRGRKASLVDVARLAPMRSRYRVTGVFDIRQSSLQNKL